LPQFSDGRFSNLAVLKERAHLKRSGAVVNQEAARNKPVEGQFRYRKDAPDSTPVLGR
jgi:hypothetical protein